MNPWKNTKKIYGTCTHPSDQEYYYYTTKILPPIYRMYTTVGWADIGTRAKVPQRFVCIPFKSNGNRRKKCFDPVTVSLLVTSVWVIPYLILRIFKNLNTYSDKMHLKKYFQE
jgi:hypothetical protein